MTTNALVSSSPADGPASPSGTSAARPAPRGWLPLFSRTARVALPHASRLRIGGSGNTCIRVVRGVVRIIEGGSHRDRVLGRGGLFVLAGNGVVEARARSRCTLHLAPANGIAGAAGVVRAGPKGDTVVQTVIVGPQWDWALLADALRGLAADVARRFADDARGAARTLAASARTWWTAFARDTHVSAMHCDGFPQASERRRRMSRAYAADRARPHPG